MIWLETSRPYLRLVWERWRVTVIQHLQMKLHVVGAQSSPWSRISYFSSKSMNSRRRVYLLPLLWERPMSHIALCPQLEACKAALTPSRVENNIICS
jgi:hypothetical protein